MTPETHSQMATFIWNICDLLRGLYKRNEYRKVILPLTLLRRFDCILAPTKDRVMEAFGRFKGKSENIIRPKLCEITGAQFYNCSKMDFSKLLDDPNQLALNLNSYINAFSPNVRQIMERFWPSRIDNMLANPRFGISWKQQLQSFEEERCYNIRR